MVTSKPHSLAWNAKTRFKKDLTFYIFKIPYQKKGSKLAGDVGDLSSGSSPNKEIEGQIHRLQYIDR